MLKGVQTFFFFINVALVGDVFVVTFVAVVDFLVAEACFISCSKKNRVKCLFSLLSLKVREGGETGCFSKTKISIYYCMGCECVQYVFMSKENIAKEGVKQVSE